MFNTECAGIRLSPGRAPGERAECATSSDRVFKTCSGRHHTRRAGRGAWGHGRQLGAWQFPCGPIRFSGVPAPLTGLQPRRGGQPPIVHPPQTCLDSGFQKQGFRGLRAGDGPGAVQLSPLPGPPQVGPCTRAGDPTLGRPPRPRGHAWCGRSRSLAGSCGGLAGGRRQQLEDG